MFFVVAAFIPGEQDLYPGWGMEDIRLTPEEVRQYVKQDLTDEQVEMLRDFLVLYADIAYDALSRGVKWEDIEKEIATSHRCGEKSRG